MEVVFRVPNYSKSVFSASQSMWSPKLLLEEKGFQLFSAFSTDPTIFYLPPIKQRFNFGRVVSYNKEAFAL